MLPAAFWRSPPDTSWLPPQLDKLVTSTLETLVQVKPVEIAGEDADQGQR